MAAVASPYKPKVAQPLPSRESLALARLELELEAQLELKLEDGAAVGAPPQVDDAFARCLTARLRAVEAVGADGDDDPTLRWGASVAHRCGRATVCDFCAIVARTEPVVRAHGALFAMYIKYAESTCTRRVCVNTVYEKYELLIRLLAREVGAIDLRTNLLAHPAWSHPKRACFFYVRFVLCWQLAVIDTRLRRRPIRVDAAWLLARARTGESVDEAFRVLAALCCGSADAWHGVFGDPSSEAALGAARARAADADVVVAEARLRHDAQYRPGARGRSPAKYVALF